MPHLSPMSWILIPALMWIILLSFSSIIWWQQTPKMKSFTSSITTSKSNLWLWF